MMVALACVLARERLGGFQGGFRGQTVCSFLLLLLQFSCYVARAQMGHSDDRMPHSLLVRSCANGAIVGVTPVPLILHPARFRDPKVDRCLCAFLVATYAGLVTRLGKPREFENPQFS